MTRWYWVSLDYATFGVGIRDGRVVETAAINRWMLGKTPQQIGDWITKKNGKVIPLGTFPRSPHPW